LSLEALNTILAHYGLTNQAHGEVEYDHETRAAEGKLFITDRYFMKSLGVNTFHALDVTDYEGRYSLGSRRTDPGKILPVNMILFIMAAVLIICSIRVALMNLSKLLKPKGRMVNIECASSWNDPYIIFSPGCSTILCQQQLQIFDIY